MATAQAPKPPTEYVSLVGAFEKARQHTGCKVNIFAAVAECSAPRKTSGSGKQTTAACVTCLINVCGAEPRFHAFAKVPPNEEFWRQRRVRVRLAACRRRADYMCNLLVVDASTENSEDMRNGVELLLFSPVSELLPEPRKAGDIIRMHKVKV